MKLRSKMCKFFQYCLSLLSLLLLDGTVLETIRDDYCELYVNASKISDKSCHKNGSFIITNEYELTLFDSNELLVLNWTNEHLIEWNINGLTKEMLSFSSLKVLGIRSSEDKRLRPASFYMNKLNVLHVYKFVINGEKFSIYEEYSHYEWGPLFLGIEFKGSVQLGQINEYLADSTQRIETLLIKGLHLPGVDLCSHVQFFSLPKLQQKVVQLFLNVNMTVNMKCFENYFKLKYIFIDGLYETIENVTAPICKFPMECEFTNGRNGFRCPANCVCSYYKMFKIRCQNRTNKQIPPLPIQNDYKIYLKYSGQQLIQLPNNTLPGYNEVCELDVSRNNISSLAIYQLPRELKTLQISYNPITTIDYEVANYLNRCSFVYQSSIRWIANCDERTLVKLLQKISYREEVFFEQLNDICPEKCKCCFDGNKDNFVIDCSGHTVNFLSLPKRTPNKTTLLFVNCSIRKLPQDLLRIVETHRITHLDLRSNYLKSLDKKTVDFFYKHDNTTIELSGNPWDCICQPRSFLFLLKNRSPAQYAMTLARCKITMCPDSCICCLKNLNSSALTVDCRGQRLTQIPQLPNSFTSLNLENNDFTEINLQSQKFLKKTILSTGLNLSLSGNPWKCICDENNLVAFAKSIALHIPDFWQMECSNLGKRLALVDESKVCPSYYIYLLILFVFSMIIITALNAFVFFKQPIFMWFYEHDIFMSMAVRSDLERMKKFDAFLCFTHKDEHLIDDYVERLEKGQRKFNLCFYLRDWQVGAFIPECIIQSVKDSRRIIILMTRNFLESTWGKLEFRLALHATSKDRCKRLIVILYPDVENFDDLDSELKAYMVLNTYLKRDSPNFWNKLIYSMPHIN